MCSNGPMDRTDVADRPGTPLPEAPAWLDEVHGDEALAWAAERTRRVLDDYGEDVDHLRLVQEVQDVLEAPDRVPTVLEAAGMLYNFWTDAEHPRGLWRRTTWESYAMGATRGARRHDRDTTWEVLLDVDAERRRRGLDRLAWAGAEVLRAGPLAGHRALITFSEGGTDAAFTEEFDLDELRFVPPEEGGFRRPLSKGSMTWGIEGETCIVSANFGPGTMSPAGMPRQARRLRRGRTIEDSEVLITGGPQAIITKATRDVWGRTWLMSMRGFNDTRIWWLPDSAALPAGEEAGRAALEADCETVPAGAVNLDVPASASTGVGPEWLNMELREPWELGGTTYQPGQLLAAPLAAWVRGEREVRVVFSPGEGASLAGADWTRHHLVLTVLDDVVNRLEVLTPPTAEDLAEHGVAGAEWGHHWIDLTGAADHPRHGSEDPTELRPGRALLEVSTQAVSPRDNDYLFISASGWTTPPTLTIARLTEAGDVTGMSVLRQAPARYDATGVRVTQHAAIAPDGTRVPYFQVGRPVPEGGAPVLLYGYGAFGTSQTPCYQPLTGKAWLERGGVYVVACTRGGGEYGPAWHAAGAGAARRGVVVDDLAAIARQLVERGVTTPERITVHGGSAGGLLAGEMLTVHPELIGAAVAEVPLMDMSRYTHLLAGAFWRTEFGDPDDPADWALMEPLSPYHALRPGREYPPLLMLTSTADDRVHPAHARTMAYRMEAMGLDVSYVEMTEGGHTGSAGGAAQKATTTALIHSFAWRHAGETPHA